MTSIVIAAATAALACAGVAFLLAGLVPLVLGVRRDAREAELAHLIPWCLLLIAADLLAAGVGAAVLLSGSGL